MAGYAIAPVPQPKHFRSSIEIVAMTNLSVFAFEGHQVRFVGTAENPEWVAADVCKILGLNTSEAVNGRKGRCGKSNDLSKKWYSFKS